MNSNYQHVNSKGVTYYLHSVSSGKGGSTMYFFARVIKEGACPLPDDREVFETKFGLPVVKKKVA